MENQNFYISCTKEEFQKIKSDERFLGLLTLARFTNSLHFCLKAYLDNKGELKPSSARTTINSFLFVSSILYEGLLLVEKLRKRFKDLYSFKDGFGSLLRDKAVTDLR